MKTSIVPTLDDNTGALMIRIGFGGRYSVNTIRNHRNPFQPEVGSGLQGIRSTLSALHELLLSCICLRDLGV